MKIKFFKLSLFLVSIQLFSSCSTLYMANSSIDPIVFTKPVYSDSAIINNYIGGKFNKTNYLNSYDRVEDNYFGQLYVFQTYTNKYFNTSYGAFGYCGKIGVNNDLITEYKDFYGGGISADIQLTIPLHNVIIKPIGIKGSVLYEDGEYYRMRYNELQGIAILPDKFMCNLSQTVGASYVLRNKSSLGVDLSVGYTSTIPHLYLDLTYSVVLNYTMSNLSFYLQKSGGLMVSNDDFAIGLNIRLP